MSSDDEGGFDVETPLAYVIHNGAEDGDATILRKILLDEDGGAASLNLPFNNVIARQLLKVKDAFGCNPLHLAILNGNVDCARVLLRAGASVEAKCDGNPPMNLAVCLASHPGKAAAAAELVQLLLSQEATPLACDDGGRTALHWAAVSDLVAVVAPLIRAAGEEQERELAAYRAAAEAGDDAGELPKSLPSIVEMQDSDGNTALHLACKHGAGDVLTALLAAEGVEGADLAKVRNKEGYTALHLAALHNRPAAAHALLTAQPGCGGALDRKGRSAAELAKRRGHADLSAAIRATRAGKDADWATAQISAATHASGAGTLVIAPEECLLHRTFAEPRVRGSTSDIPPENVERLHVITKEGSGVLHTTEFSGARWQTRGVPSVTMSDLLRCHDWSYVRRLATACAQIPDNPAVIGRLDVDTAISHGSYVAALKAAGSVCDAVDKLVGDQARSVFCAVRPPGHHAGPDGLCTNANDPNGSHGFCLFSNVAIGAAYALNVHRATIKRVAILDFDVHHGNGTQAVVANTHPTTRKVPLNTPYSEGVQVFPCYKPWLDTADADNILFASVQGYGQRGMGMGGWFYPGSGATGDTRHLQGADADAAAAGTAGAPPATAPSAGGETMKMEVDGAPQQRQEAGEGVSRRFPEDPDGEFAGTTADTAGTGGPRIINVGVPGPGGKRQLWRRAWRDKILPALVNFKPDMIFVSAGFDAHKKDDINMRYVGVTEADYEWLTDQICQVANRCCKGRVVSVLEGGYNVSGGFTSTFARSVAAHVRALSEVHSQAWDPADSEMERQAEAKRRERTSVIMDVPIPPELQQQPAAPAAAAPEAAPSGVAADQGQAAAAAAPADGGAAAAGASPAAQPPAAAAAAGGSAEEPAGKRRRRGLTVDYAALNAKLEAEASASAAAKQQ